MRTERGFTLLEVLIAFAIAALALAVLFRSASSGVLSVRTANKYDEAVSRARSHLAAIGRNAAIVAGQSEGDDGGGYQWHLTVAPLGTAKPAQNSADLLTSAPLPTLYAIDVGISWVDGGRRRDVVLHSERMGLGDAGLR